MKKEVIINNINISNREKDLEIDYNKVKIVWESLKNDNDRFSVKKGKFPHDICYFELNFAEHIELQRMAKKYFQKGKKR